MRRLIVFAAFFAVPAFGSWKRYFIGDPSLTDQPAAQPLAYFRADPCKRRERTHRFDFCGGIAKIRSVGAISGFKIFEIDYYAANDSDTTEAVGMTSILIQTGPDRFREISVWQPVGRGDMLSPAVIVDAGRQRLLVSKWSDGGNDGTTFVNAFLLLADGAIMLDLQPVYHAAAEVVPQGKQLWLPTSEFDFASRTLSVGANDDNGGKIGCCAGKITVGFHIDTAGRVVAEKAKYEAE